MTDAPTPPAKFTSLTFGGLAVCIQDDSCDSKERDTRAFSLLQKMIKLAA